MPLSVTIVSDQEGTVGDNVTLPIPAQDQDGDTLRLTAEGLPPGLSIDSATGVISGTLTTASDYAVTIHVSDGEEGTPVSFRWRVLPDQYFSVIRSWDGNQIEVPEDFVPYRTLLRSVGEQHPPDVRAH